ncbi:MAG: YdcF family protein [Azoarcus sp.]|jgi:uncharacterized SAM-binding protein YcdF (DUF218 family)|nr:YdcF family protein [Azoarcus sp.]
MKRGLIIIGAVLLISAVISAIVSNFHFGIAALGGFSVAVLAYGRFWYELNRIKWLRMAVIGICFILILFSGFLAVYGNLDNAQYDEDVVIILGAGIRGEEVSSTLARRLDEAVKYHGKNPKAVLVVSGGMGSQERITEALAMERYLIAKGIPAGQIIKEEKSTSTYENFLFSGELLKQKFPQGCSIAFITNDFHVYRAERIARSTGIDARRIGANTPWYTIAVNYLREMAANIKAWVFPA